MPAFLSRLALSLIAASILASSVSPQSTPRPAQHPSNSLELIQQVAEPERSILKDQFLPQILKLTQKTWLLMIPETSLASLDPLKSATISFTIHSGGKVTDMHLVRSTKNVEFDKSAWYAISSNEYPEFPSEVKLESLVISITFNLAHDPAPANPPPVP